MSAGPSTHRLSLLSARNGSQSISGAGLDQPAAGFQQQLALVGNDDLEAVRAARKMRFERVRQIMDVDHDLAHAGRAQLFEHMVEQRLAADLDQRLGPGRGQRPHALAEARRHDHRRMRDLAGTSARRRSARRAWLMPPRFHGSRRCSGATLASNQSRTGSRPGWARSRSSKAPHARLEAAIMRLVVALPQPREDAEDARVALRGERPIGALERLAMPGGGDVAVDHRPLDLGRDVAPRILEHRGEVIGRVARQRVLEIEQAEMRDAARGPRPA